MNKVLSGLSLAQKAGQIVSGGFAVEKAIRGGKAYLVIVAEDSSENTKKQMNNMTSYYGVPLVSYGTKTDLGQSIGKEYRSMVAILGQGFADSILKQLENL